MAVVVRDVLNHDRADAACGVRRAACGVNILAVARRRRGLYDLGPGTGRHRIEQQNRSHVQ